MSLLVLQIAAWTACFAVLVSTCVGVYSIYREAAKSRLDEQRDRFLEGHQALVEYLITTPHDTEEIHGLSADVIRYSTEGVKSLWMLEVLEGLETDDVNG